LFFWVQLTFLGWYSQQLCPVALTFAKLGGFHVVETSNKLEGLSIAKSCIHLVKDSQLLAIVAPFSCHVG
jgi:hypothetical protein